MSPGATENARRAGRTNTMLSATIEFGGKRHHVFVRNVSASGALIQGKQLPLAGDAVVLHRADTVIPATVAWTANNQSGLSFGTHVEVDELIRRGKAGETARAHQARVDSIQRALREHRAIPSSAGSPDEIGASVRSKRLVDELGYAHRLVETVNEALSNDTYVLSRYAIVLQQLDEAEQLLRKLTGNMSGEEAPGRC